MTGGRAVCVFSVSVMVAMILDFDDSPKYVVGVQGPSDVVGERTVPQPELSYSGSGDVFLDLVMLFDTERLEGDNDVNLLVLQLPGIQGSYSFKGYFISRVYSDRSSQGAQRL